MSNDHFLSHVLMAGDSLGRAHAAHVAQAQDEQLHEALSALKAAGKPTKFRRLAESFQRATFRVTESRLAATPGVTKIRAKGKIYYQWAG